MADFTQALKIVQLGLEQWREKPHNSKWWKLIDGTPIPNDLCVVIAETLVTSNAIAEASTYSRGYQDAIEERGLPARPVPAGALEIVNRLRDYHDHDDGYEYALSKERAAALVEAYGDSRVAEMRALIDEAATALEPFGNAFSFPEDEGWSDTDKIECFLQRDERDKDGLWLLFVLGVPAFRAAAATLAKLRAKDGSDE